MKIKEALSKKFDKSKWKLYKFSEIAENIVEKVVPKKSGLKHYIGLEHLDTGSLKIRRYGDTSTLIGDKLKIYKGDLIFAKRNAYLKRVAVAEFDAVASAHSMVLRAKSNIILPEFLPFFMLSNTFWERAIEISVGSLSPTINWKALAKQEFLLPPKDQQAKLAKLLWAADEVVERDINVLERIEMLKYKKSEFYFVRGCNENKTQKFASYNIPMNWELKKMDAVSNIEYGISKSVANNTDPRIGWQIITGANLNLDGTFNLSKKRYIEVPSSERFKLRRGDLLFNWRSGSPEHIGKTAFFDLEGTYTYASFILRIRCGKNLNNRFAFYLLNFLREIEYFTKNIAQQVNFKINATVFREIEIPIPPKEKQEEIAKILDILQINIRDIENKIQTSKALLKSIINEVF